MSRLITGFCLCFLVFCTYGIAQSAVNIRFAHGEPEDQTYGVYASMLAKQIDKLSHGEMKATVFANGVMGAELEAGQKVQQGTLHMALVSASNAGSLAPSINVVMLPYFFASPDDVMGEKGQMRTGSAFRTKLTEKALKETGTLRILGVGTNGFRLLFTKNKPVTSLSDLKGLKLRLPANPVLQRTWDNWGAAAFPLAWSETFTGIQQGVADAYESPLDTLLKSGFYPYTKFVTEDLSYVAQCVLLLVNEKWYQGLKPEQKEILNQATAQNDIEHFAWVQDQHAIVKKELQEKGVSFHNLTDAPVWEEKALKLWPEFAKISGGQEWVDSVLKYRSTGKFE